MTLGEQMKRDLDALLERHPGPWRWDKDTFEVRDAHGREVNVCMPLDDDDTQDAAGIIAAVNFYHAITSPTPRKISDDARVGDAAGGRA